MKGPSPITSLLILLVVMLKSASVLTDEDVDETLSRYLERTPTSITGYTLVPKSDTGLGYMGVHLDLTVDYTVDQSIQHRKRFFVKTYNTDESGSTFLEETGLFQREIDFYKVILGDMRRFLPNEVTWCPRYCFSKPRILVLEDLSENGFVMARGDTALDEVHAKLALATLAAVHASSLALENNLKSILSTKYYPILEEIVYIENRPEMPTAKWISWQIQDLLVAIDMLQSYTEEEKAYIKTKFPGQMMRIYPLSKPPERFRNVLTHGDIWKNNLMFRYGEDGTPVECKVVDFQFFRYAPPAHDVMNFLHLNTTKAFRDALGPSLLRHYHDSLVAELTRRNLNPKEELSLDEFLETCTVYKELALVQSLYSNHYILGPVTLNVSFKGYQDYDEYLKKHRSHYMKEFFGRKNYVDKITEGLCELIDNYITKR